MGLVSACIPIYLTSGFLTFIFTKLEVAFLYILSTNIVSYIDNLKCCLLILLIDIVYYLKCCKFLYTGKC